MAQPNIHFLSDTRGNAHSRHTAGLGATNFTKFRISDLWTGSETRWNLLSYFQANPENSKGWNIKTILETHHVNIEESELSVVETDRKEGEPLTANQQVNDDTELWNLAYLSWTCFTHKNKDLMLFHCCQEFFSVGEDGKLFAPSENFFVFG